MLSAVLLICLPKAFCSSAFGGNRAPRAAPRAPIRPRQSFASFAFLGPRCDSAFAKCESNPSTSSQPHLECHGHLSRWKTLKRPAVKSSIELCVDQHPANSLTAKLFYQSIPVSILKSSGLNHIRLLKRSRSSWSHPSPWIPGFLCDKKHIPDSVIVLSRAPSLIHFASYSWSYLSNMDRGKL